MIQFNSLPSALVDSREKIHIFGFSQNVTKVWLKPVLLNSFLVRQLKQTAMNFSFKKLIKSSILQGICIFIGFNLIFNNLFAQDFHQRQALSVEELIYRQDPNRAKAMFKKGHYLVLENLRKGSRTRFYEGEMFRFRTKDDFLFENDIYAIKDSSIVIASLNEVSNRYEFVEIRLDEIKRIYKFPKKKIHINLYTFAPVGYLFIEWAAWQIPPLTNKKLPLAIGLSLAQPFLGVIANQFRSRKITENYRLRIFQSF